MIHQSLLKNKNNNILDIWTIFGIANKGVIWTIGVVNEINMWIIQNSMWFPDDLNTIKPQLVWL